MEANPSVLTKFAKDLGLTSDEFVFGDMWGIEPDLLSFLPQPVIACILLFPSKERGSFKHVESLPMPENASPFFLRQIKDLDDACGTIAMVLFFHFCVTYDADSCLGK